MVVLQVRGGGTGVPPVERVTSRASIGQVHSAFRRRAQRTLPWHAQVGPPRDRGHAIDPVSTVHVQNVQREGMMPIMKSRNARNTQNNSLRLSRRGFLLAGAAAGGALAVPGLLTPTRAWASPATFKAYHGVDSAGHQQHIQDLSSQNYRMISLSVYGSPVQYAAVWVQRSGPTWRAVQDLTLADYLTQYNDFVAQGYVPTIVTATGPSDSAVFAGVFEKITATGFSAYFGFSDSYFPAYNASAKESEQILKTLAVYGTDASDRRYAAVWLPNSGGVKWNAGPMGDDGTQYDNWQSGYTQAGLRPVSVDANDGGQYAALFTDDLAGDWVSRHDLTSTEYQDEFDTQVAAGLMPISVQGSGSGSNVRYSAVFVSQDPPIARQWTQVDSAGATYTGVHGVVKQFMQRYGVRAGQLAIRKNGTMKLASGYTWSEPGAPTTQPTTPMRLASVSKAFTSAAISALVQDYGFDLNTKVFSYLGITTVALPTQTKDSRVDDITVQELVDHSGGWSRTHGGIDPVFEGRMMAQALGLSGHVTKRDVARYMYGEPLQFTPGAIPSGYGLADYYSNFGYLLLGLVVERRTGQNFIDYVKNRVLTPLGLSSSVFLGTTLRSDKLSGEVSYDAPAAGLSAWDPWSTAEVPSAYGTFLIAEMDSGGGLVSSAPTLATFIGTNAAWGMGGRSPNSNRTGEMPGTASRIESRPDDIDWAYIFNTNEIPAEIDAYGKSVLDRFADAVNGAITAAGM